ncbi:MAG TPA: cysteine desulfurase [Alphaproteobacteria bacterium]|nr:cysteine desulfurase [Alphaproteobacteria bacterium]
MRSLMPKTDHFDIAKLRDDFPALSGTMNGKSLVFLDTAASAQKPRAVIEAIGRTYESGYANIHRGLYRYSQELTEAFEAVRVKVARFIGAESENEIVFTRNATEGINLVAQSWGRAFLKAGDEVIVSVAEHHANIVPWQLLADQIGIVLKVIPVDAAGVLDMNAYTRALSGKTRLVAMAHISNVLGTVNPVKEITVLAKAHNPDIAVLIDGSQAVVHGAVNVRDIGCDFYVFTGHKLYGPTGVGVLYGRREVLDSMPPYQGGGDMIETVSFSGTVYKNAPYKFEAGTPAIAEIIGLGAAVDYMASIPVDSLAAYEQGLLDYTMKSLADIDGLRIHGTARDKAAVVSFSVDKIHHSDIAMVLDQMGIAVRAGHHCAMPLMEHLGVEGTVRASIGLYTNKNDIDELVKGLRKAKELLG